MSTLESTAKYVLATYYRFYNYNARKSRLLSPVSCQVLRREAISNSFRYLGSTKEGETGQSGSL
jgi:hypothetical protein